MVVGKVGCHVEIETVWGCVPRLEPEEFELLTVAELESKCTRRIASPSFRWTELGARDRLESQ
jgi:hypothetical protein